MGPDEETLVVIEDDHHIADLVGMYLRRDGFRVLLAPDGESGLELVGREHPRLVIVDIGLPGALDGLDVCRALRSRPERNGPSAATGHVPILVLSARDDEVDRVLGLELGADDYVTKPFSPRELVARVHAILRRANCGLIGPPSHNHPAEPAQPPCREPCRGRSWRFHMVCLDPTSRPETRSLGLFGAQKQPPCRRPLVS